jgi:anaerobic ribonucleoside-triphosphate reductase activating protein
VTVIGMRQLRLGHSVEALGASLTNGPGWRVCLWTQGCSLRCTTQCLNPHFLSSHGGWLYQVAEIGEKFRELAGRERDIEGVTVLGGEPFDQPTALADLLGAVRRMNWSTMVYTGHTWEDLAGSGDAAVLELLGQIDVLVDGPFLPEQYCADLIWRGSRNQRLLCLTDRYKLESLEATGRMQGKAFSIHTDPDGSITVSGIQERPVARAIETALGPGDAADRRRRERFERRG